MRGVAFVSHPKIAAINNMRSITPKVWCSKACAIATDYDVDLEDLKRMTFDMSRLADDRLPAIALGRLRCDGCGESIWDVNLKKVQHVPTLPALPRQRVGPSVIVPLLPRDRPLLCNRMYGTVEQVIISENGSEPCQTVPTGVPIKQLR